MLGGCTLQGSLPQKVASGCKPKIAYHTAVVWLLGSLVQHMMNDERPNCTPENRWRFIAIGGGSLPYDTIDGLADIAIQYNPSQRIPNQHGIRVKHAFI